MFENRVLASKEFLEDWMEHDCCVVDSGLSLQTHEAQGGLGPCDDRRAAQARKSWKQISQGSRTSISVVGEEARKRKVDWVSNDSCVGGDVCLIGTKKIKMGVVMGFCQEECNRVVSLSEDAGFDNYQVSAIAKGQANRSQ